MVLLAQAAERTPEAIREVQATALTVLLAGVAIVGLLLIAAVVLWGSRLRRINREGRPEPTEVDPFEALRAEARRNVTAPPPVDEDPV